VDEKEKEKKTKRRREERIGIKETERNVAREK